MLAERLAIIICGLCLGAIASAETAAEETTVDMDFLEYLGMWEETDEEWLLHDDMASADQEKRSDPAPDGEESPETDDED